MQQTKRPEPLGQRGRAKQRYFFKQVHHNKHAGDSKQKFHWSRHPEQRRKDAALLALFGLGFERVENTSFSRISGKRA